ncbi:MAG: DUF3048 domain-containing protein [Nocardioides sp.]
MRRAGPYLCVLLAGSLALTACGGSDKSNEPQTVTSTMDDGTVTEVPKPEEPQTWPLTGVEAKAGASVETGRRVLVVKMDNTSSSQPQIGLSKADLVVEELVEGGITRLAAFYYSTIPGEVGPIRSMRASDIGIVAPANATIVTSGGAGVTVGRINGAKIPFITEGAKGIYRASDRSAPYNLMSNLTDISKTMKKISGRPDDYLPFGNPSKNPKGRPAKTISANFGNHTTNWIFQGGKYENQNSFAADGDHFPADQVLVLRVQIGDAGYTDPAGYPVPETKFVGTGEALLFTKGRVVRGTWAKKDLKSPLTLKAKGGDLVVPPGRTWIELVPAVEGNVAFTK